MPDIRRILIVKLSAMGDVLHALPAAAYLRKAAPSAEVHWAVDTRFAGLLDGNPGIAKVVSLPIGKWKGAMGSLDTVREAFDAAGRLRGERYDLAIDIQGNIKSGIVTYLSAAPIRYGFPPEAARERQNAWFTNRHPPAVEDDRHVTEKILRVVSAPFGLPFTMADFPGEISIAEEETSAVCRILEEALPGTSPRLAVHPGTTWTTKRMPPSFWAETVRIVTGAFPGLGTYLSWGTQGELEECAAIRDLAGGARVALLPRLGYKALAAAYRACGHAAGPDTGPLHLAAIAGARTVSVFRATDGNRNAPRGPGHRFLQAPMPCKACLRKRCDRDEECRASIRPEEAAAAIAELMGER